MVRYRIFFESIFLFCVFFTVVAFGGVLEKEVTFSQDDISFTEIEGYDFVRLEGCKSTIVELGAPCLPKASFSLLIPQGAEVIAVEIISLDTVEIAGDYKVYPTQHPQPFIKGRIFQFVEPDEDIYSQTAPYPEKVIQSAHTGSMGGYKLASLLIYPIQYIPADKKLIFHSKIKFRVTYEEKLRSLNTKTEKQNKIFKERVEKLILNPEDIGMFAPFTGLRGNLALPTDSVEYVIITGDSFKTAFQELADWKTRKGIPARVVTLDSIYANYTGADNAERVRNFIIDANSSWGTIWVLLGGQCDYEWGQEIVPRRNVWYRNSYVGNYPDEDTIPSDLYFSDLDGDWNADGDGVYGESTDDVDFYSDVFVGRAPVRTIAHVETFVNKVFTYEKRPPAGYQKKILLPAAYLWPSIYDERLSQEAIADIVPSDWQVTRMYERDGTLTHEAFVDSVKSGFGFAHLIGHGNESGVYIYYADEYFGSDDLDSLGNDGLLGIHNSIGCMCGGLDLVPYGDCFAEHYLTPSTGGSYSIMNSRYGWGRPPDMGPSENIDTCLYHEIFKENYLYHDHLGAAHAFSKDGYVSEVTWSSTWAWCIYELNLFGDPELPLWTDNPGELTVTHDAVIPVGANTFAVNVSGGSFGVEEAFVCLYKEGEVYQRGYTDAFGNINLTLSPPPNSLGIMYCTVTKNNYIPYEGNVDVIFPSGPWVIFDHYTVIDLSGTDNNVDPGDNIELPLTVYNVGLDDGDSITGLLRTEDVYVNITDSLEDFGNILADSLSQSLEDFDFDVAPECPVNHIINFELITKDRNDSTWSSCFSIPILTPDISLSADTLNFDTVYIGYADTLELEVNNVGGDTLVISDITSDNMDYSVDTTNFSLPPNESQIVMLVFAPTLEGISTGNLTIESNDLDFSSATVFVQGEGLKPPDISVSPDSLRDSLFTGETSTHLLTIYNTGESELNFDISITESLSATKFPNISFKITDFKNNKKAISEENSETTNDFRAEFSKRIYESDTPTLDLEHILVMERGPGLYYYDTALDNLGLSRTLVTSWDELHLELNSGTQWELVIINSYGNSPSNETLDLLDDYQTDGGFLIYADWALYLYSSHSLLTSLGIGFVSNLTTPLNFYAVNTAHKLFNSSNDIDSLYWTDNQYNRDAAIVDVLGDATQLAYFGGYPDNGAIVLNAEGNCLFNAFQSMNFNSDDDSDGKLDIVELIENEIKFLSVCWLSVDPQSGTIPSVDSALIEITFDATNLYGGDYFADIIITSNDPDETELVVPANLHVTGAPDIAVSEDTLNYDIVFSGYSATDTLIVANVGTDLLTVNNISSDNFDFTVDATNFTLDPEETQDIVVTFTPSSLGMITGTLTIDCDDPDEPTVDVLTQGVCLEPPDISVSPDSLSDSLLTGEISTHTLTIYNTGLSELIFDISVEGGGVAEPVVSLNTRMTLEGEMINNTGSQKSISGETAAVNQSNSVVKLYKSSKTRGTQDIAILGSDGSGSGSYLDNIAQYLINSGRFTSGTTINGYSFTPGLADLQIFDAVGVIGWYGWGDPDAIGDVLADYVDGGGNVFIAFAANATGGGWTVGGRFNTENYWLISPYSYDGGISYSMGNVYEPGHPIMAGVNTLISRSKLNNGASVSAGATLLAEFEDGTPLAAIGKVGDSRCVDISFPFFTTAVSDWGVDTTSDVELLIINAFDWVMGPDWLSTDPVSDAVPAGNSISVEVTFDATGLYGGDYFADINISSNDPDEPEISVPTYLHVTGAPDIVVSEDTLDYGIVFYGSSVTDTLIVSNEGSDSLTISNISFDYLNYTVDTTSFTLNSKESQEVVVTFTPSLLGTIIRILSIECNDPDESTVKVFLRGECVEPPDIVVFPDSLSDTLSTGETSTHALTIYNTGKSDLNFDISVEGEPFGPLLSLRESISTKGNRQVSLVEIKKGEEDTRVYPAMVLGIGGPDGFGYRWKDSNEPGGPTFNWIDVSGGTSISLSDDDFETGIPLGFTFNYYGTDYTEIGVGSNGWLSFNGSSTWYPSNVPAVDSYDGAIAPFARDLYPPSASYIRYQTFGTAPNRYLVIEYHSIPNCCPSGDYKTFEVILYESSNKIKFQYLVAPNDNPTGFGIESPDESMGMGNAGLDSLFISPAVVEDNYAIEFSLMPGWISLDTASGTISASDSILIEVTFDATDLDVGDYYADIIIVSNDPDEAEIIVPAHLHVLGSGIEEKKIPKVFFIKQNYPNPFGSQTVIKYGCPRRAKVCIEVFDVMGRVVTTLVDREVEAGYHELTWRGDNKLGRKLANAVYFYRMQTNDFMETKKMVFLE